MIPVLSSVLVGFLLPSPATPVTDDTRAGFALRYRGELSGWRVNGVFVASSAEVPLAVEGRAGVAFTAQASAGTLTPSPARRWTWRAPAAPGHYAITVLAPDGDSIRLNVFVLVPFDSVRGGWLNGYRIGTYPTPGGRTPPRPAGFVEVTRENRGTLVGPHFRLEQFLCKQEGGWPKYVVLTERLVLKLEYLLGRVRQAGHDVPTLHIMSGYRTPYYNRLIGNVPNSRHVYGQAADIFVDADPRDGVMDDLDGNSRVELADADWLHTLVERQVGRVAWRPFLGGLSRYRATSRHGPFVHVDVRGHRARW